MSILDFTVEEVNMIAIYITDSRKKTIKRIHDVYPLMDEDMKEIARSAASKLIEMGEAEFRLSHFIAADETDA